MLIAVVTATFSLVMAAAWLVQRAVRNAGWVDAIWTFALGAGGTVYALAPIPGIAWPGPRQVLIAAVIGVWAARLGIHLVRRTWGRPEDSRYAQFRQEWGPGYERRMFWFLQIQAAAAAFLALTVWAAARNPAPLGAGDGVGLALVSVAYVGAAIADAQLQRFREEPRHRGRICDRGLWRWSRHPNYFFEWLGWLAYPFFAVRLNGADWGLLALTGPAFMYVLLVHVSGIPPLEQQMLRTRGQDFRTYRARTNAFFPWPR